MKNKSSLHLALCLCVLGFAGCGSTLRQDMANQPRQNPLSPAPFFQDDRSERPLVDNTVMRGAVEEDALFTPKIPTRFPYRSLGIFSRAARSATTFSAPLATGFRETVTAWSACAA